MDQWKLWLLLLLPLCLCFDSEVTLVKTISKEPDVTPICTIKALNTLTVVCKISTERTRGKQCRLLYKHEWGFVKECDSRFTLMIENQTVFLHLTGLTPVDRGNYTCQCSRPEGTYILHLNISVEASYEVQFGSSSPGKLSVIVIFCVGAFIIVPGVVLGRFLRIKHCRDDTRPGASWLPVCEIPCSVDQDDPDDPYDSLQHPACDVYENFSSVHYQNNAKKATAYLGQEIDGGTDQNFEIYENI